MARKRRIPEDRGDRTTLELLAPEGVESRPDFATDVRATVGRMRRALSAAFSSLTLDPAQGREMARVLGLEKMLAWKLSRVVIDEDPIAAVRMLPGRPGQQALVEALKRMEAAPEVVEQVRKSFGDFESMVATHAGDRETFVMMLSELTDNGRFERDIEHRKHAFLGNSAMWGVQARVRLSSIVLTPGDDPDFVEVASVSGLLDFRRLRSEQPWTVASYSSVDSQGSPRSTGVVIPLDPRAQERGSAPLLLDYCSPNFPQLTQTSSGGGSVLVLASPGPVGNSGLLTCLTGLLMKGVVPRWWQAPNQEDSELSVMLATPCEMLLFDLFVHHTLTPAMNPRITSFGALPGDSLRVCDGPKRRVLRLAEDIIELGAFPPDLTAFEMGAYPEMMEWVFKRIGHDASEFRGFRFRQRYPLIPTKVAYHYESPKKA